MVRSKYDFIVEAVHYKRSGGVDWMRGYERRGPTFSDFVILTREQSIQRLKAGQKFMVGRRVPYMASTFEFLFPLRLVDKDGKEMLATGEDISNREHLVGVPIL